MSTQIYLDTQSTLLTNKNTVNPVVKTLFEDIYKKLVMEPIKTRMHVSLLTNVYLLHTLHHQNIQLLTLDKKDIQKQFKMSVTIPEYYKMNNNIPPFLFDDKEHLRILVSGDLQTLRQFRRIDPDHHISVFFQTYQNHTDLEHIDDDFFIMDQNTSVDYFVDFVSTIERMIF